MLIEGDGEGNLPCTSTQSSTQSLVKNHVSWLLVFFLKQKSMGHLEHALWGTVHSNILKMTVFLITLLLFEFTAATVSQVQAGRYTPWMDTPGLLMSSAAGISSCRCHQEKHLKTILLTPQAELQPSTAPEQMLSFGDNSEINGSKSYLLSPYYSYAQVPH